VAKFLLLAGVTRFVVRNPQNPQHKTRVALPDGLAKVRCCLFNCPMLAPMVQRPSTKSSWQIFAALGKIPVNAIFFLIAAEFLRLARIMRS